VRDPASAKLSHPGRAHVISVHPGTAAHQPIGHYRIPRGSDDVQRNDTIRPAKATAYRTSNLDVRGARLIAITATIETSGAGMNEPRRGAFLEAALPCLDAITQLARHLSGQPCDAEDLVQETYMRAYAHFDKYRGGSMRAWLATICLNVARSEGRRLAHRPTEVFGAEPEPPLALSGDPVADAALAHLDQATVRAALARLPEPQRLCIALMDIAGYTASETAQVLGCPRGTVLARAHRGRVRLARILARSEANDARE
jgi:RNA polymerase sigma-70 factor, ECF subfamily